MKVTYRVVDTRYNEVSDQFREYEDAEQYIDNKYESIYRMTDIQYIDFKKNFIILPIIKEDK